MNSIARLIPLDKHMASIPPSDPLTFAADLARRLGDQLSDPCASCRAPMTQHFAASAVTPENPNGFTGCPAHAQQQALVTTVAELLVTVVTSRHGIIVKLRDLPADVREEYRTAAGLALSHLGVLDPRRG